MVSYSYLYPQATANRPLCVERGSSAAAERRALRIAQVGIQPVGDNVLPTDIAEIPEVDHAWKQLVWGSFLLRTSL